MEEIVDFFTRFSLRSPAVVIIALVLLFAGGVYSAQQLPLETMPDLDIPVVTIATVYPGAGPQEVLEEITKPIEQATRNIANVKTQTSTSSDNVSVIVMEFEFGNDLDKAKREIEDAVASVNLPGAAQSPKVGRISFDSMPIMRLAVAGKTGTSKAVVNYVNNEVIPDLRGIDGVGDVQMSAQANDAVKIQLRPEKLKEYNLTSDQISGFLMASNLAFPAGELSLEGRVMPVTVGKKFDSIQALKDMPLLVTPSSSAAGAGAMPSMGGAGASAGAGGRTAPSQAQSAQGQGQTGAAAMPALKTVTLGEIADISRGSDKTTVASRLNNKPAVGVTIIKDPDANTVDVADDINAKIDSFRATGPEGLKIKVIDDQSIMVRNSVNGLVREGLMGAVLAMLVILIFLGNWRSTLIAVVSIPLSIMIGIIALRQLGYSLNIMSLAGLAVATGRIVDDSIVVIENIFRHRQKNDLTGNELVEHGTKEVASAITSSTLTGVGAFIPLAMVSGIIGQVFEPFAVAAATCFLASLLVAVTVVPLMAKYLIAGKTVKGGREVMGLALVYRSLLEKALNHKVIVLFVSFAFFAASLGLAGMIGSNFLPAEEQPNLNLSIEMAAGTSFKVLNDKTKDVEALLTDKAIKSHLTTVGNPTGSTNLLMGGMSTKASSNVFIELKDNTDVKKFTKKLRNRMAKVPGKAEITVAEASSMGGGMSAQIEVLVIGDNLNNLRKAAGKIQNRMTKIDDLANVESNLQDVKSGVTIDVDNEKAAMVGLTNAQIGSWLRELLVGKNVTRISIADEGVDVDMGLKTDKFNKTKDLAGLQIPTPMGIAVPLGQVATVRERPTPVAVTRRGGRQYASIAGDITTSDSGKISRELKDYLDHVDLPKGISTQVAGVSEYMEEGFGQLGMAMLIAIAMVYLIMVLTFGEARAPLAILFSLPFAATGALIALYIGNQQINVSSMIGGLMLIGIVVTNAIVLIELVQQKRKAGVPTRDALLEGGTVRLRPVLMTALTTIIALIPLGLGVSDGGLISQSLAVAVMGGLTTSTVLTLIIVPVIFEILADLGGSKNVSVTAPEPEPVRIA
jgi:HAE1 family hydrophobic/amphiphilic exporter-1